LGFDTDSWYQDYYSKINASAIEGSYSNRKLHRFLEKGQISKGSKILEVGSNKGEHIKYVAPGWDSYLASDLRALSEKDLELIQSLGAGFVTADVEKLQFDDESFDRVISTCLLHHLPNPEVGLREMLRVTKPGGVISILLPNDPGFVYRIIQNLTTFKNAKQRGLESQARLHHAREHRNHYLGLLTFIQNEFIDQTIQCKYFPLGVKSFNFNALTVVHVNKK